MDYHSESADGLLRSLGSSKSGLEPAEAERRLASGGPNSISIKREISPLSILVNQFKNTLVILLLFAALVSLGIGFIDPEKADYIDAVLISLIVVANAIFGFFQEYKAERSIEALTKMAAPKATVVRGGREMEIDSEQVVSGDVILLDEGDKVPADARLLESFSIYSDESSLTGESVPVNKRPGVHPPETPLAERTNMLYMNSVITRGRGSAVVVATGLRTEVGKIAKELSEAPQKVTRFQLEIEDLGGKVSRLTLAILVIIAATEFLLRTGDILFIFIAAVALGVAAIPEGLPAVVTLALSIATSRMLKEKALMRRLSTVQDLGSVDVICTDKTGTLTENVMTVTRIYLDGMSFEVTGKGRDKEGEFRSEKGSAKDLETLLRCAVLCNDAREREGAFKGDPTEIAVLLPAYKAGLDVEAIRDGSPRVGEAPFSAERKLMSVACSGGGPARAYVKGAPEMLLPRCTHILAGGRKRKLSRKDADEISRHNKDMASGALRVLAFACKDSPGSFEEQDMENGLVFLGLMGMIDPPRTGVKQAIDDCRSAGIRVIMVTGDNRFTAEAVGRELGFAAGAVTGDELDGMTDAALRKAVEKTDIYARTSPKHKVMLLKALRANDHVVCMTGDGVNDAAAIKNSDVGIAMGIRGTEVTKQASDMIVLDDNFITIRNAIAEGRATFDNIRKFVVYLLGANIAEVLVVFLASISDLGISSKIAIQLLWINLVTDGLPALALGVDPPGAGIMKRRPRSKDERIVDKGAFYFMAAIGISAAACLIALYAYSLSLGDRIKAETLLFTIFVVFEMIAVYAVRWKYRYSLVANKWLHMAVALSIFLQLAILYSPLSAFFGIVPLGLGEWEELLAAVAGFLVLLGLLMKLEPFILGMPGKGPRRKNL
jgi:Ca2+-transporting ATPase